MANLSGALTQLRAERDKIQQRLEKLGEAILVLEQLDGSKRTASTGHGKRMISAASRRKMALAQKARWAKFRSEHSSENSKVATPSRKPMSIASRRKIAAAQRARWAKQKQAA